MGRRRERWSARLDLTFFVLGGLSSIWLAYWTLEEGIQPGWPMLLVLAFWGLVTYLVLPRIHRILTRVYVPDYFIGRTRTADGILGDPVNLALRGSAGQVQRAMEAGGWTRADDLSFRTGWGIVVSSLTRRSYPTAPVSPLVLFRRTQDFAYQQEVAGSPSRRHHVRFWRCPDGWLLPGGTAVDWLAAGTYDRRVGLSLFTLQVTHKIDEAVDAERDHIVATVTGADPAVAVQVIEDFSTGYHSRNGGGDLIQTDGDLPILDLTSTPPADVPEVLPASVAQPPPRTGPPPTITFGAVATALRGVAYLVLSGIIPAAAADPELASLVSPMEGVALGWVLAAAAVADFVLAAATYIGSNVARLSLCALSVASIVSLFLTRALAGVHGPLHEGLFPYALGVLVLLALSSDAARAWTSLHLRDRRRRRPA